jgi:hypothetical protein
VHQSRLENSETIYIPKGQDISAIFATLLQATNRELQCLLVTYAISRLTNCVSNAHPQALHLSPSGFRQRKRVTSFHVRQVRMFVVCVVLKSQKYITVRDMHDLPRHFLHDDLQTCDCLFNLPPVSRAQREVLIILISSQPLPFLHCDLWIESRTDGCLFLAQTDIAQGRNPVRLRAACVKRYLSL